MTTLPPQPPGTRPPLSEQDDDRTRLSQPFPAHPFVPPAPPQPADDDLTRISMPLTQAPAAPVEGDDATRFMPLAASPGSQPPPSVPQATEAPVPLRVSGKLPVGTIINNNYRISEVLKAGGMGEVYRGVEIGTGDPVAIKAILPELAEDEKVGQLFRREARTLRQLSDEAIVRYYNYVHDLELGRYFLVMEFVEGVTLSDQIAKRGPVPLAAARTLLDRLAKGLSRAHAQEVIHRDLSPDNVMLPDGLVAEARLIDFGIAKSNVVKEGTMAGQFAGKFKYVAPEQLGHFGGEIGPQTDIYGLALLMCAALIGKPLNMGSSIVEAVQSRQSIPDLSEVSPEIRPILAHMLEPDPKARPATMDEVRRLLAEPDTIPMQYLQGLPMPMPFSGTGLGTTITPSNRPTIAVPGLQRPGLTQAARMQSPATTLPPSAPPAPEKRGGLGLALALGLVLAAGVGGYWGWTQGLLPFDLPGSPEVAAPASGLAPVLTEARDGFLAGFLPQPCSLLSRVTAGANAGVIEGFSAENLRFDALPEAFVTAFGARVEVVPRAVSPAQCAALDLVRAVQGRAQEPVSMVLSHDRLESGGALDALISQPDQQVLWVAMISPLGAVYNLTNRLEPGGPGQRKLSVGLSLRPGAEPAPQLLIALATDTPLTRTALADGTAASESLPAILEELRSRGGRPSAAIGWVLLTQPGG